LAVRLGVLEAGVDASEEGCSVAIRLIARIYCAGQLDGVGWIQRKRFLVVGQGVFRNETMSFLSVGETAVLKERRGDRGGARDAWSRGEEGAGQRHGQATKIKTLVQTIHPGIRGTLSVGVPRVLWGEWPSAAQTTTESLQRNGEEEAYGLATGKTDSEQMPEHSRQRSRNTGLGLANMESAGQPCGRGGQRVKDGRASG
jgi:hypothetical protein